jgi:hypothetical protein
LVTLFWSCGTLLPAAWSEDSFDWSDESFDWSDVSLAWSFEQLAFGLAPLHPSALMAD